jgi:hypothetical protein
MLGVDKPRVMRDDELNSGQGVRQWLIECRLYSIQKALYAIAFLLLLIFAHAVHPEWGIWH